MNIKPLVWSEFFPPDEHHHNNYCIAETPLGRFLISWKSWKDNQTFVVKETPWGEWGVVFGSLQEAKENAENNWQKKLKECFDDTQETSINNIITNMNPQQIRTCPECNFKVENKRCTNQFCNYRGIGWTLEQRTDAWAQHGVEERSAGGGVCNYDDYD